MFGGIISVALAYGRLILPNVPWQISVFTAFLRPAIGAVLAVFIVSLAQSELIQSILPQFMTSLRLGPGIEKTQTTPDSVALISEYLKRFFGLISISFIAGFSERFATETITRALQQRDNVPEKKSE